MNHEKDDEELDLTGSKWSVDKDFTSEVIYESLCENYGTESVDAVLKHLELVQSDVCLGDNTKIITRILNGDL